MKNVKLLKGKTDSLLNRVSGEDFVDASGQESSVTDHNFDILRQHYAGTDFETEANSLCDVLSSFGLKNKHDFSGMKPIIIKIKTCINGEDGNPVPGFEPYNHFVDAVISMLEDAEMHKASPDVMMPSMNEHKEELPNVKSAQAKLIELEQYLNGMNLQTRQKWKDYISEARQKAAVGDDTFNANPELAQDDMEFLRESNRQKQQRESSKNSILQSLVGVQ